MDDYIVVGTGRYNNKAHSSVEISFNGEGYCVLFAKYIARGSIDNFHNNLNDNA